MKFKNLNLVVVTSLSLLCGSLTMIFGYYTTPAKASTRTNCFQVSRPSDRRYHATLVRLNLTSVEYNTMIGLPTYSLNGNGINPRIQYAVEYSLKNNIAECLKRGVNINEFIKESNGVVDNGNTGSYILAPTSSRYRLEHYSSAGGYLSDMVFSFRKYKVTYNLLRGYYSVTLVN